MSKKLTIVIPELTQFPKQNFLKKIFFKIKKSKNAYKNFEDLLFCLFNFGKKDELPIAAVSGLMDGLATENDFWLRADPAELRADLKTVYFLGNEHLSISSEDCEVIKKILQPFLEKDALTLHTPHPKRWYLQSKSFKPDIKTTPFDQVLGKSIDTFLPEGPEKNYWNRLLTEIQMLLHEKKINGLWFWGAGKLPKQIEASWKKIWSDEMISQGLSQLAKINFQNLPSKFSDCLRDMQEEGEYLIVMKQLPDAIAADWLQPLVMAVCLRQLNSVRLYIAERELLELTRR